MDRRSVWMNDVSDIEELLKKLDSSGNWFYNFLNEGSMVAGIIRLMPKEKDSQGPHVNDELYYVMKGNGFLNIENKDVQMNPGSIIFVPAKKYYFHGNEDEFQILYVFAGEEKYE